MERDSVDRPFTIMAHKPNYFLLGTYNHYGYSTEYYQDYLNDPSDEFDESEVQFQISLKVPLWVDLADSFDIFAGYTNRSFWQFYNAELSRPFRETNHEPELWARFSPGWEVLGFTNSVNDVGIVHQSNGRAEPLSRSWNSEMHKLLSRAPSPALIIL